MKGLHKIIYPFAPDQSGAVSVLYELGGLIVVCDAGGCAGNICGFDEPRWMNQKAAVFSAGLRDMDAILGRDELMVDKMADAVSKLDVSFAAVIGTPVPATIAADYRAIKNMAEKKCGIPVLTIDTNGIRWYDRGEEKAYKALFETFADDEEAGKGVICGTAGVIGAAPLDTGMTRPDELKAGLKKQGFENAVCYCLGSGLSDVKKAGRMEKNIVVSPSGLSAAKYLEKRFGTPYEACFPLDEDLFSGSGAEKLSGKRILIIHQQIFANAVRERIRESVSADIDAATWFMQKKELKEEGDFVLKSEDQFVDLLKKDAYDVIICDRSFWKAGKYFGGEFIDLPHFAVSGHLR